MKKPIYLIFALFISLSSCRETDKILTFPIKTQADIVIPAAINVSLMNIPTPDIKTNSRQEFSNNNTRTDLVKDVRLTELVLDITQPTNKTFSFLKSITVYVSAEGVQEKKLAYLNDIPNTVGNSIKLNSTNEKLDEIVKKDFYNIRTEVVTDEAFFEDIKINAKMTFKVTADIL